MRFARTTLVTVILGVVVLTRTDGRQARRTMTLDFLARDASGQTVAGLTAADLTLKVGGREPRWVDSPRRCRRVARRRWR